MQTPQLPPARHSCPHGPRHSLVWTALLLTLAWGCSGPGLERGGPRTALLQATQEPKLDVEEIPGPEDEKERRAAVVALLQAGDYEEAREQIDQLLFERELERARRLLERGNPEDALVCADRALALSPRDREASWLKAQGSLQLAETAIARGGSGTLIEGSLQDALAFFARCADDDPRASFGASRAALQLGRTEEAVRWARDGRDALRDDPSLDALPGDPGRPATGPHRVVASALFRAYVEAKSTDEPREDPALLFAETEQALGHLLGRRPDSAWAWRTLSDLHEWEERYDAAHARLLAGIERVPGDAGLLERLARVARKRSGREGVIEAFSRFVSRNPNIPLGHWLLAVERFDLGLERMNPPEGVAVYDAGLFDLAEAGFVRCRELSPLDTHTCLGYEVVCRSARGWCAFFGDDDLETARREFLSMNDLFAGGITWSLEGRLESGVMGLAFVGDQYNNREEWLLAGEAFELAQRFEPEEAAWANNAGFFLRDAAVELELEGQRLCRAAHGRVSEEETLAQLRETAGVPAELFGSDEERALFAAAANRRMLKAREVMTRSWLAYQQAARLDANDVRTVNDAGLVLVYYLHENLEEAERLLLRCVEMGVPQVEALRARMDDETLTEEERADLEGELYDLENALGDAYQNLGVLEWVHHHNGARAIPYLESSVVIGPDPRPMLTNNLMPLIRAEREPTENEYFDLERWAAPCDFATAAGPAAVEAGASDE